MSNETKRDVFDDATFNIKTASPDGPEFAGELRHRYAAALPDDLPVIPRAVGTALTQAKKARRDLPWVFDEADTRERDFGDRCSLWMLQHSDTFARAWVLEAWRVEETGEIVKLEAED